MFKRNTQQKCSIHFKHGSSRQHDTECNTSTLKSMVEVSFLLFYILPSTNVNPRKEKSVKNTLCNINSNNWETGSTTKATLVDRNLKPQTKEALPGLQDSRSSYQYSFTDIIPTQNLMLHRKIVNHTWTWVFLLQLSSHLFYMEHMETSLLERKVIQQLFHLTSDDVIIKALKINLLHRQLKE